jgi:hypothetical protein
MKTGIVSEIRWRKCGLSAALFSLALASTASAQETNAPSASQSIDYTPVYSPMAPPPPRLGTSQLAGAPPVTPSPDKPLYEAGPVQFRPHIFYRLLYGDGLQARPGQDYKTLINEISPGMLFVIGKNWTLDYTPTLRYYSNDNFRDTLDHSVFLRGNATYRDWLFGLSQGYVTSSEPLVETGSQTDQETYATALNAVYFMSTKASLELGLNQDFRFMGDDNGAGNLSDSRTWSTMDWFNYQFAPSFGAAIGAGGGYIDMSEGSDMTFEQLQGRVSWRARQKLSFVLSGGFDFRQFLDSDASNLANPIYSGTINYQPFDYTTLSLTASRSVNASYYSDSVTEDTSLGLALQQRLLEKLFLSISGGYRFSTYKATDPRFGAEREDDGLSASVRLSVPVLKRGSVAVFYSYSENSSDQDQYSYNSSQVGLELGYRF